MEVTKKVTEMRKTRLQNDCWYSGIQVTPQNWNTTRVSMREPWLIWYRFYDPAFKDHKSKGVIKVRIKAGINDFLDREDRQAAVRLLIEDEKKELEQLGWNPFTKQYMKEPEPEPDAVYRISPEMPWPQALEAVRQYMKVAACTQDDLKSTAAAIARAAVRLRIESIPVSQVKRLHVKRALEQAQKDSKTGSDKTFNRHRTYLLMLFNQLMEEECIEHNPVTSIKKLIIPDKGEEDDREELTEAQRAAIDHYFGVKYPSHQMFFRIFFKSNSRFTEMALLQGKYVDLEKQEFKVWVLKGKQKKLDTRVIADLVLPEWEKAMENCGPEQYVFGNGYRCVAPSDEPRDAESFSRFWRRNVKECRDTEEFPDMAGITADPYSTKHTNSNEIAKAVGAKLASIANGHTSVNTTLNYYAKRYKRELEKQAMEEAKEVLRKIGNTFGSSGQPNTV